MIAVVVPCNGSGWCCESLFWLVELSSYWVLDASEWPVFPGLVESCIPSERLSLYWSFIWVLVPERLFIPTFWFNGSFVLDLLLVFILFLDFLWSPSWSGARLGLLYIDYEPVNFVIFLSLLFIRNHALACHWTSDLSCSTVRNLESKVTWNCGDTNPGVRYNISATLLTWFGYHLRYIPTFNLYSRMLYIPLPDCNGASKTYYGHSKGIQWFYLFEHSFYWIYGELIALRSCKGLVIHVWCCLPSLESMSIGWQCLVFTTFCFDVLALPLKVLVIIVSFVMQIHLNDEHSHLQMLVSSDFLCTNQPIYMP